MPRNTYQESLDDSEWTGRDLQADQWVRVADLEGDNTDAFTFGSSDFDQRSGNAYTVLQDSSGNSLNGAKFRVVTYRSSRYDEPKSPKGTSGIGDSYEVANMSAVDPGDRTTWANFRTHKIAAGNNEHCVLEMKVPSGHAAVGNSVDPGSSDYHIPVTRIR